jgi:hypothetical protein
MDRQKAGFYFWAKLTDQRTWWYTRNIRQGMVYTDKREIFICKLYEQIERPRIHREYKTRYNMYKQKTGFYFRAKLTDWKTSGYTTFFVWDPQVPSSFTINIFRDCLEVTRDTATYNWPCENTGVFRYKPTEFRVCPWLLFIVIA